MPLELIPLCDLEVNLLDPIFVGDGPAGTRIVFEVESGTKRAPDEPLNLARPTTERPIATVAIFATFRVRAGMHLIFRGDPPLAATLQKIRHARIDGGCAQHHCPACAVQGRALCQSMETRLHPHWTYGSGVSVGALAGHGRPSITGPPFGTFAPLVRKTGL